MGRGDYERKATARGKDPQNHDRKETDLKLRGAKAKGGGKGVDEGLPMLEVRSAT